MASQPVTCVTAGSRSYRTATRAGSTTGASNSMSQPTPASAGSRPSSMRAARSMPWAIAPFMPNSVALGPERWMGFQSPETPA